jgi:signal transduction histidine kinase
MENAPAEAVDPPLNFVSKSPIESALAETLAGVSESAWVIDAERGVVVGANGRGSAVWGIPTMSPVLDSVLPALRALRNRFAQGSFLETTASTVEPLKFWTASGVRTLACEVRTLDESVGPGLLLVIAGAVMRPVAGRRDVRRRELPVAAPALRTKAAPVLREEPPSRSQRPPVNAAPNPPASARAGPSPPASPLPNPPASPPLNDMETLREIARRIRQGSARITAGVDAPANQDEAPDVRPPVATPVNAQADDAQADERHAQLAHEIRTPLAAIISLAEVITEERLGPWPNERYRGYVRDILSSARHGLEVVDGILRDAPNQPGSARVFAELDLNAEVEAICTSLQPLAEKSGARLDAALIGGLPRVIADRRNVRQMLLNLISNSIKHGGVSVRIKVTTGYELSGEVWVEVEDNGPGMPPAEKAGPATAPRKAGLGLPLTRSLAAANGARLDIKSRPSRGVRARIVFGGERSAR